MHLSCSVNEMIFLTSNVKLVAKNQRENAAKHPAVFVSHSQHSQPSLVHRLIFSPQWQLNEPGRCSEQTGSLLTSPEYLWKIYMVTFPPKQIYGTYWSDIFTVLQGHWRTAFASLQSTDCSVCSSALLGSFGTAWYPSERVTKIRHGMVTCFLLVPFWQWKHKHLHTVLYQTELYRSVETELKTQLRQTDLSVFSEVRFMATKHSCNNRVMILPQTWLMT